MKMRFSVLLGISISLFSCTEQEQGNVSISGTLPQGVNEKEAYLYRVTPQNAVPVDTVAINEDGTFTLVSNVDELGFYQFGVSQQNRINLGLQPDEQIELSFTNPRLEEGYSVKGSPESAKIQEIIALQIKAFRKSDSINQVMQRAGQSNDIQTYMQLNGLAQAEAKRYNERLASFAEENNSSIAALIAIQQLNPEEYYSTLETVVAGLEPVMTGHFFYDGIAEQVKAMKSIAVGAKAPELAFENPKGEVISLSSLRGKYVLIDFWASWCKPCRMENPNVVRTYTQYKDKGFEILGVSLDKSKDAWVNAIAADGLTWPQMSDLGGWQSQPAQIYGVRSIPATVLVDPDGIIIAKNLRGPSLEEKLKEVLGA